MARAADRLGYEGVLTPTGTWCEDAWLTAAALLAETERLKFLVAFRPGLVPPTLAAQQTATLQRFSEGRVLLNIVSGGDDVEQRRFGDWLGHDERYARTGEFLHIVNSVWRQESVDFDGEYYNVEDAGCRRRRIRCRRSTSAARHRPPCRSPPSTSTSTSPGVSRRRPPPPRSSEVRKLAEERGRNVRFGIRLHTISRDTSAAAWAVADELLAELSPTSRSPKRLSCMRSRSPKGQRRMTALHGGRVDQLEIYPNLWAGRRAGPRRCGHRAGRQPRGSRQPDLRVPLGGLRRVHPVGLPAPRGGVLVRRRRAAAAAPEGRRLIAESVQQLYFSPMSGGGDTFCRQPNGTTPASLNRAADWWA